MKQFIETAKKLDQLLLKSVEVEKKLLNEDREIEENTYEYNQSESDLHFIPYFVIGFFIALLFCKLWFNNIRSYKVSQEKM